MGIVDKAAVTFDEPILYKGLYLYPAMVKDYTMFKQCSEILTLNMTNEKDIHLLGLPYLEYVYRKSQSGEDALMSTMLLCVLSIVLQLDTISFYEDENENVFLNIFKQNSDYDKYKEEYDNTYLQYRNCIEADGNSGIAKTLESVLLELKQKMFDLYTINSTEFDELKNIICEQNDINQELIDPAWEQELQEARKKIASLNHASQGLEFRDLLIALSYDLKKTPDELSKMSVSTFDRYVDVMLRRESFSIGKAAEAAGAKFKKPIPHWLNHYEPKGKYDDVIADRADSFIDELDE